MLLLYGLIIILLMVFLTIGITPLVAYYRGFLQKPSIDLGIVTIAFIAMPIIAVFLYLHWGASQQLNEFYTISQTVSTLHQKTNVQEVSEKLQHYLDSHPNDAKGWYLLGRLDLDQNQIKQALISFKKSLLQDPENIEVQGQYVQALYLMHHRFTKESMEYIENILSKDPKNTTVLNLLATDAFAHHRYAIAILYWQRLRNQYPENSQEFRLLSEAIDISKKRLKS